jgi:putative SOS response-associated peptidase YedK
VSDTRVEELYRETDAKPFEHLPVCRRNPETGEITITTLCWGLIPHRMRARPEKPPINARAETISERPMFKEAYARRRCIVSMNVFYERDKRRKLHAFGMKDGKPFGVAGIWENWRNSSGEWERTFCIIPVSANELVGTVHDRMPAIVPIELHARWLGNDPDPCELLGPFSAELMRLLPQQKRR